MTSYEPETDGEPDPGEVVWAWVPYEDDPGRGKDRPVLLIGRKDLGGSDDGGVRWAGLMLSSQDHDRDEEQEAAAGRHWMDIGTGAWDPEHRPSEVRLDRLIILEDDAIRREGAAVSREVFDRVVAEARRFHASTSGQTLVYGASGHLTFAGGITGARGHEGDNPGRRAVTELLMGNTPAVVHTAVFGCSILGAPVADAPDSPPASGR